MLLFARKGECILQMGARQAGGIGNHGPHTLAEHLMRRPGQKGGVHASGVRNDQPGRAARISRKRSAFSSRLRQDPHSLHFS